jgi:hypothetical protein
MPGKALHVSGISWSVLSLNFRHSCRQRSLSLRASEMFAKGRVDSSREPTFDVAKRNN